MEQQTNSTVWIAALVALIIGLGGGYYYGKAQGISQEQAVEATRKQEADTAAAKAVNPFESAVANPFEAATPNPYDAVKTNPFK